MGNGVTVAYRFLAQVVAIADVFFQISPGLIRLFPADTGPLGKLYSGCAAFFLKDSLPSHPRPTLDM
jgi:hypothetical protein